MTCLGTILRWHIRDDWNFRGDYSHIRDHQRYKGEWMPSQDRDGNNNSTLRGDPGSCASYYMSKAVTWRPIEALMTYWTSDKVVSATTISRVKAVLKLQYNAKTILRNFHLQQHR